MQQLIFNNFPVNPIVIKLRFIKSYQLDNITENVAGQQPLPNERTWEPAYKTIPLILSWDCLVCSPNHYRCLKFSTCIDWLWLQFPTFHPFCFSQWNRSLCEEFDSAQSAQEDANKLSGLTGYKSILQLICPYEITCLIPVNVQYFVGIVLAQSLSYKPQIRRKNTEVFLSLP